MATKQGRLGEEYSNLFLFVISDLMPVALIGQNLFKIRKQEGLNDASPRGQLPGMQWWAENESEAVKYGYLAHVDS